jgi:dipeptidyl aminopeptidase/acylaminoacyl peptidase
MKRLALLLLCLTLVQPALAQQPKPRAMEVDDLFRFKRVSEPQISPDGKWVVYGVGVVNLEANKTVSNLWLAATDGATPPKQLTKADKSDRHPRWSPDGKSILFESSRSGTNQLWLMSVPDGKPQQITTISTGASSAIWSNDGKYIAFVSAVWPEYSAKPFAESDALNKKRMDEQEKSPVKARVATKLFFRHWDDYVEDKRQHLFVLRLASENGKAPQPLDVTPGDRDAYPTSSTFSSNEDFTFSPDGKYLVFTGVPEKDEAWSTNYDIYRVPITGGKIENLTKDNAAADSGPQFSPDGKWLAYRAQKRAGFEADRWQLMVMPADGKGKPRSLTADYDKSVDSFVWLPDSSEIEFAAEDGAAAYYYSVVVGEKDWPIIPTIKEHSNHDLTWSKDGSAHTFIRVAMNQPAEVMVIHRNKFGPKGWKVQNLSKANEKLLAELDLPRPESVTVKGADGTPVQMWILKPPGFDAAKKWPLAFLVHGGPQGAWEDGWSYRWNAEAWAAQGYVVALPNPRGSTGFGQKFVDEISSDWGGKCYVDLMACLDHMEKQPWIDKDRMGAAGASFGGYMMNWFAVNTGKFKTLITHCGVWNFDSMYATTEELWFDEWEHGGPPWGKNRDSYEKHSPHRLAANLGKFKTPMLVIHNDLDFRVPVSEGIQLFTTLQRQGVPSRFVNFPDEGHWVLKPRNSQYWYGEVFTWMKKYVPPGGK